MPKFQPGQSGNPKGRPKGARNVATQYLAEANAPAEGTPMTKLQAAIAAQFEKAMGGDLRAVRDMVEQVLKAELARSAEAEMSFTDADREVIAAIYRRMTAVSPETEIP